MNASECITPFHLDRQALIYVRQSSPHQTLTNQESLKLQYALRQRAQEHGWMPNAIDVIDTDLGRTGSTTEGRQGFKELVARVSLGQVGIIFAYDMTRLARNCTDWYQLLDLCGYRPCLVGDQAGVYDPATTNGRLILGLKGLISGLELHTIHSRLTAGILSKAQRGELALQLPVGLVRDPLERVLKHPDQEVQGRIDLVFATFLRLGSVSQVVRRFNDEKLLIPRKDGFGDIHWRPPTITAVNSLLHNPAYAGASGPWRSPVPYCARSSNGCPWTSGRSASVTSTRPILTGPPMRESRRCSTTTTVTTASKPAAFPVPGRRCCKASSTAGHAVTRWSCWTRAARATSAIFSANNIAVRSVSICRGVRSTTMSSNSFSRRWPRRSWTSTRRR